MRLRPKETDPRVVRTRKLLLDAFLSLMAEKDFNVISVRDITSRASVNRATFYAHFSDKYELLESFLVHSFETFMVDSLPDQDDLTEQHLVQLILIMCEYHRNMSSHYKRSYNTVIPLMESTIHKQLEGIFIKCTHQNVQTEAEKRKLEWTATMISWSIYGVAARWNNEGRKVEAEKFAQEVAPFILYGLPYSLQHLKP
ncbi:TetR/AcrR family transcriptional regulator [Paenibacillus sp. FSL R10-2782]|uniref:TetR/AcrR family transcriptional regulator n=1 Tax=Paenibacillus sp. FSL R10-2782 TaxID=2954661 RepID=UPI00315969C3